MDEPIRVQMRKNGIRSTKSYNQESKKKTKKINTITKSNKNHYGSNSKEICT